MSHPYYIVAPAYVRISAGVRVLHLLCDRLRKNGSEAYVIADGVNPALDTPHLTAELSQAHWRAGRTPIVIYPEILHGNPLDAPFVVRYLLNTPGALGGPREFDPSEYRVSYARGLDSTRDSRTEKTLFFPASDTTNYFPPTPGSPRAGRCFYAGKYKWVHHGKLFPVTDGATEIMRDGPRAPTPAQIADLFRRSDVFYCYENSALTIEATLCGCPVILLPNEHFREMIASEELGRDGIAWGNEPAEVDRARATVGRCWENYARLERRLDQDLRLFVDETQRAADRIPYREAIRFFDPYIRYPGLRNGKAARLLRVAGTFLRDPPTTRASLEAFRAIRAEGFRGVKRLFKERELRFKLRWLG